MRLACWFRRRAETIFFLNVARSQEPEVKGKVRDRKDAAASTRDACATLTFRCNFSVTFTLQELATMSGGELIGDPAVKITGAASLAEATTGEISFFVNRKYVGLLRKTRASAVFVPPDFAEQITAAQIRVSNPAKAFEQVMLNLAPKPITFAHGIHPSAIVDPGAQLGERVSIQPHAVIEAGAKIGDDTIVGAGTYIGHETVIGGACLIYPRVTVRERTCIGSR